MTSGCAAGVRPRLPNTRSASPPGSTSRARPSRPGRRSGSASPRSARSRRGRSRAIRGRGCSGCRDDRAIINRFGFNSVGADRRGARTSRRALPHGPCASAINVGKNKDTPNERAADDYVRAIEALHPFARLLRRQRELAEHRAGCATCRRAARCARCSSRSSARVRGVDARAAIPVLVKVSPDMPPRRPAALRRRGARRRAPRASSPRTRTVARPALDSAGPGAREAGGLSGAPLKATANDDLPAALHAPGPPRADRRRRRHLQRRRRLRAHPLGRLAVQVYTALIYEGPGVVPRIVRGPGRAAGTRRVFTTSERRLASMSAEPARSSSSRSTSTRGRARSRSRASCAASPAASRSAAACSRSRGPRSCAGSSTPARACSST